MTEFEHEWAAPATEHPEQTTLIPRQEIIDALREYREAASLTASDPDWDRAQERYNRAADRADFILDNA